MAYLFIVAGFVLLTACAEVLVRGAVAMSERLGIPPLVVGLTVVAFGTSAPELVVSVTAALNDVPEISVGNVVGSNIANILLILGFAGVIWPISIGNVKVFVREGGTLILITALFTAILLTGQISALYGWIMVVGLVAYIYLAYRRELRAGPTAGSIEDLEEFEQFKSKPWWMIIGAILIGLAGVMWGADLLVEGATVVARSFGVPEEVIGLTLVAFGTSLPELATTMAAAWKHQTDVAIGNVIGSCVFNILCIMGITAIVRDIPVPAQINSFDVWVMLGASMIMLLFAYTRQRIARTEAALLSIAYLLYVGILYYGVENVL